MSYENAVIRPDELDSVGRLLGRWLAPYVAPHLPAASTDLSGSAVSGSGAPVAPQSDRLVADEGDMEVVAEWDDNVCRIFVRELGDTVVQRAEAFFGALAERRELTSVEVKELLGLPNQRSIGANLTVSLRKRVKSLGLPSEPWEIGMTPDGERTIWRDRTGIARRMQQAAAAELSRRGLAPGRTP